MESTETKTVNETKVCRICGERKSIDSFQKTRSGKYFHVCRTCLREQQMKGRNMNKTSQKRNGYSDPDFDGKTPREVQNILERAARWLNNYDGFSCDINLRYEKNIKLNIY